MKDANRSLERLRSDLDTMQSVLGGERLPFNWTDVRFTIAATVSLAPYLAGQIFFHAQGYQILLTALPFLVCLAAYLGYMAVKSRRRANAEPARKTEYRMALWFMALLLIASLGLKRWARELGADLLMVNCVLVITLGVAFACLAFLPFASSRRYRQVSFVFTGVLVAGFGFSLPYQSPEYRNLFVGIWFLIVMGGSAIMMAWFLRRQEAQEEGDAREGSNVSDRTSQRP